MSDKKLISVFYRVNKKPPLKVVLVAGQTKLKDAERVVENKIKGATIIASEFFVSNREEQVSSEVLSVDTHPSE